MLPQSIGKRGYSDFRAAFKKNQEATKLPKIIRAVIAVFA
jgi:hypothetical protein